MPAGGFSSPQHQIAWLEGQLDAVLERLVPVLLQAKATGTGEFVVPGRLFHDLANRLNAIEPEIRAMTAHRQRMEIEHGQLQLLEVDAPDCTVRARFGSLEVPDGP
jgi:hypothetical protein